MRAEHVSASAAAAARAMQVGLVLQPESISEKVLVSLHGLTATIDNTSKVHLNVESAHIGDATEHMEPGENVLLKAPISKTMSDALSKQINLSQTFGVSSCCPRN